MTWEGEREREREGGKERSGEEEEKREERKKEKRERNKSGEKMERTDRLTNHETPLGYADRWGTLRGGPRGYAVEG